MSSNEPLNGDPSRTPPPREPDPAHSASSDPAYHGARPGAFTTSPYLGASDEWAFAGGAPASDALSALLARNWWAIALRGVFAILFGIVAIAIPGVTIAALVVLGGMASAWQAVRATRAEHDAVVQRDAAMEQRNEAAEKRHDAEPHPTDLPSAALRRLKWRTECLSCPRDGRAGQSFRGGLHV